MFLRGFGLNYDEMKAKVLSDTWKANLSIGDVVSNEDYPEKILLRANEGGYVAILSLEEMTVSELKELAKGTVDGYSSLNKSELIDELEKMARA